ncbi:MAG: hypothetical protein GWP08_09395 [Nitrospiraceae bacterium]|nr:hypothetical protein [Nitrospiraceae bacterium]
MTSTVVVHVTISDFFDDVVSTRSKRIEAPAESAETIDWDLGLDNLGFYRVVAMWEVNGELHRKTLRIARIESYAHDDSVFGMNHAPSTNEMCRHMRKAGSVYAREWAMEWEDIEPQPGNFTFDKADAHVNRVLSTGMRNVQQLPPFPSVSWNSEAPEGESVDVPHVWWHPAYYAPKDVSLFVRYADTVVRHFKDRIQVWEYLNEPFYTIHALPNVQQMDAAVPALVNAEYTVEDYIALLRVFYETVKKADPTALTIGGMGGRPDLLTKEFFQAGGLDYLDIFNLHIYPGLRKPEGYVSQMAELLADMSKTKAGQKPIWITEASYYGVDELPHEPYIMPPGPWAANRLLRDERESADYATRFNLIMLAHGVEKVFYHWGGVACADPNAAGTLVESWMTDFAGTPRKLYVAQSVLANLLGPNPRLAATLKKPPVVNGVGTQGVYGYAFQCGGRGLLAAWAPSDENPDASWFLKTPAQAQIVSIVGVELPNETVALGDSPVYVVSSAMPASEIASACKLHRASMS